jgi:hypothetical protein
MDRLFARSPRRTRIPLVDRLDYFLRSRASKVVVLALVANTLVAQLLYNSAGQLVLGNAFVLGYLLISAVCSTFAFALFEVSTIFQLHDLMALDASINPTFAQTSGTVTSKEAPVGLTKWWRSPLLR